MATELVLGLTDMEDYRDYTLEQVGYNIIREKVDYFLTNYNAMVDTWLDTVVQRNPRWNSSPINRYEVPYESILQDVDEDGKATPNKRKIYYDMGLPLFRGEAADGMTWEASRVRTVDGLNDFLVRLMQADRAWMLEKTMQALFYNSNWTFNSTEEDENIPATIPIYPLANNDTRKYVLRTGGQTATANHYTAQANQPADGADDPFQTIYDTLNNYAGATGRYVAFVNGSTLVNAIRGLTDFVPVLKGRYVREGVNTTTLDGAIQNELFFGDEVLGEHTSGVTVVQWHKLPQNYIVAMDMGMKPLGMREKVEPQLQGLFNNTSWSHYGNEWLSRFRRIAGFGVVNPVAAYIRRTGSGSYAVPTGMTPRF